MPSPRRASCGRSSHEAHVPAGNDAVDAVHDGHVPVLQFPLLRGDLREVDLLEVRVGCILQGVQQLPDGNWQAFRMHAKYE